MTKAPVEADSVWAELLGSPKVVEGATEPVFVELTAEQLKQQLKVVSSRSYAFYGFNNFEVQFERERGIYDHDTYHDEVRAKCTENARVLKEAGAK